MSLSENLPPQRPSLSQKPSALALAIILSTATAVTAACDDERTLSHISVTPNNLPSDNQADSGNTYDTPIVDDINDETTDTNVIIDTSTPDVNTVDIQPDVPDSTNNTEGSLVVTVDTLPCSTEDIDLCELEGEGNQRIFYNFDRTISQVAGYNICRPENDGGTNNLNVANFPLKVNSDGEPVIYFEVTANDETISSSNFWTWSGEYELSLVHGQDYYSFKRGDCVYLAMFGESTVPQNQEDWPNYVQLTLNNNFKGPNNTEIPTTYTNYEGKSPLTVYQQTNFIEFRPLEPETKTVSAAEARSSELGLITLARYSFFTTYPNRANAPIISFSIDGAPGTEILIASDTSNFPLDEFSVPELARITLPPESDFDHPEAGHITLSLVRLGSHGNDLNNGEATTLRIQINRDEITEDVRGEYTVQIHRVHTDEPLGQLVDTLGNTISHTDFQRTVTHVTD